MKQFQSDCRKKTEKCSYDETGSLQTKQKDKRIFSGRKMQSLTQL